MTFILPFIEQGNLYNKYNMSANWYDAVNQTAVNTSINVYQCPAAVGNHISSGMIDDLPYLTSINLYGGGPISASTSDYANTGCVDNGLYSVNGLPLPGGVSYPQGMITQPSYPPPAGGTPGYPISARLFRCSGRLFSKIHRKSLDLSGLRPVNRMASLPP